MNKKGQLQIIFNPKTIIFVLGGAFIGFILFNNIESAIVGGIVGLIISILK